MLSEKETRGYPGWLMLFVLLLIAGGAIATLATSGNRSRVANRGRADRFLWRSNN